MDIKAEFKLKVIESFVTIPGQRVSDLLCNAVEGGSNYWIEYADIKYPEGTKRSDYEFPILEVPFFPGGMVIFHICNPEPELEGKVLNLETIQKGLEIMMAQYPNHYADFIAENDDAITGDIFLQCCLFGKPVFG
jgi:hypothetical protein